MQSTTTKTKAEMETRPDMDDERYAELYDDVNFQIYELHLSSENRVPPEPTISLDSLMAGIRGNEIRPGPDIFFNFRHWLWKKLGL